MNGWSATSSASPISTPRASWGWRALATSTFPLFRMWVPGGTAASRGRRGTRRPGNSHRSGEGIMIEKPVDIKTPDGVADAEWFCPDEAGQWPGIIMYTNIGGLRPGVRGMARGLAPRGVGVAAPHPVLA